MPSSTSSKRPVVSTKLPIPSFTDHVAASANNKNNGDRRESTTTQSLAETTPVARTTSCEDNYRQSSNKNGDKDENDGHLMMDWKEDWLKQIETALSIRFLPTTQASRNKNTDTTAPLSVSLEEFRTTLKSLTLDRKKRQQKNGTSNNKASSSDEQVTECTLLLELLCVGSPSLYSFARSEDNKKEWKLELVPYGGNRLTHLKSLLEQTKSIPKKTYRQHRKAVRRAMTAEMEQREQQNSTTISSRSSTSTAASQLGASKSPAASNKQETKEQTTSVTKRRPSQQPSSTELILKLGDALWYHAQTILQYDAKQKRCAITFQDVVKKFSKLVLVALKSSPPKQQLARALRELQKLVPEFLSFDSTASLKKATTIWVHPSAYRTLREKLGAPLPPKENNGRSGGRFLTPTSSTATRTNLKVAPSLHHRASKRTLASMSAAAAATAALSINDDETSPVPAARPADATPSPPKRPRVSPPTPPPRPSIAGMKRPLPPSPNDDNNGTSENYYYDSSDENSTCPLRDERHDQRQGKKKRRGLLRMNPHFILTDADYHGGEIIDREQELLLSDSTPRGLKRLFSQMNQGRRI